MHIDPYDPHERLTPDGMTPVEYLDHSPLIQPDLGDDPIQPLPDPRRAIGHEGNHNGLGSTHPVQMKRNQFD